jgi:hypothetical protein
MKNVIVGVNDLATTHPELAKEAHGWDPKTVIAGTGKKLEWKCSLGHVWLAGGNSRIRGTGCSVCDNKKILIGYNDLATTHPELAKEAHGWDPKTVIAGTGKKLEWKCSLGHVWTASGDRRTNNIGCPICAGKKIFIGYNDLATTHPDIAAEAFGWDPKTVSGGSDKKRDWKCSFGHVWNGRVANRSKGRGCPICSHAEILIGYNDLSTTHPQLAKEAVGWDPKTVSAGTDRQLEWKCQFGHQWITSGATRKRGRGCPTCAKSGFDPNENGFVYFLIHHEWEIYQIGITNIPEDRLARHKRNGFELLELRGPMDGHTTQELETALLRYLKSQKADLSPEHVAGKFDGYSESWTIDSYKVNNLKELIDKASEAGF